MEQKVINWVQCDNRIKEYNENSMLSMKESSIQTSNKNKTNFTFTRNNFIIQK